MCMHEQLQQWLSLDKATHTIVQTGGRRHTTELLYTLLSKQIQREMILSLKKTVLPLDSNERAGPFLDVLCLGW